MCSQKREGTVRALGRSQFRATPEQSATSGTSHPRYRMTEMPLWGIIRVVPWIIPPLTVSAGAVFFWEGGKT